MQPSTAPSSEERHEELHRSLGLFDSTMIVAGSMIGSGIFIVSAEMARQVGSAGWLLTSWVITGLLTIAAALSYGELAAMMPRAGGQYVYLREAWSPLWGFLYGWTLFLVIQTGTVAAVAVGFARYLGVLWPRISESNYLIPPIHISSSYALSLSTAQLVGILLIGLLTWSNSCGIQYGKIVQNAFTSTKIGALLGVIGLGIFVGWNAQAVHANFSHMWAPRGYTPVAPGLSPDTVFGLVVALAVAQVGSLFAADAWNNITFTAGEVKAPQRNVPLSLALGTMIVIALYTCANLAYVVVLPLERVQHAPADRVAGAMLQAIFPAIGAVLMAVAIMISTFGAINGCILAGPRAYYAMANDGLFFKKAGELSPTTNVPVYGLIMQGIWSAILTTTGTYSNLLDYVVFAALLFYVLTVFALFILRRKQPDRPRPCKVPGYPYMPAFYLVAAILIMIGQIWLSPQYTGAGLLIIISGLPAYAIWSRKNKTAPQ